MFPRSPGPSSTVSGLPVSATGSPGRMPDVSSYTWTTVLSPRIWMTSPMSCSVPTSMTSYMRGRRPIAVTTGPATRSIVPVPLMSSRAPFALAATSPPHLNRSTPIARLTFVRRSSSSAAPTAMTTGRATVSSRRRIEWLSPFMSAVSRTRIPTSGSSRISASLRSISSFVVATARRTPTSLNPWTKSSRPTAAISISHHQEFADHVGGKPALFAARDEPDVLDLSILPYDEVEDGQDRERVQVRIPSRFRQVNPLDFPQERANRGDLGPLEFGGDFLVERVLRQAAHETGLVEGDHPSEVFGVHLMSTRKEDRPGERGLGRPCPQERLQVDDVDLPLDEHAHEAIRLRRWRHGLEQFLVVQAGDAVLPVGPVRDLGGARG